MKDGKKFQPADFQGRKSRYGVNWVVMEQPGIAGMDCVYQNRRVRVRRAD